MQISINENAPVSEWRQIFIKASPEKVWEVLSAINDWPNWQSSVTHARMEGPLAENTIFRWKAGGVRFTSRLHTVVPGQMLGWTGKTIGASAIHNWYLEPRDNGTLVRVEESLQGFLPSLMKKWFTKDLKKGMKKSLKELRAASEKTPK
ncbi:SRPBCC family protein [Thermophagus sp. OGC60D27]|uniref:SRPBCC family protein n=1 Tax=Thermophagus sp. OGC60D27 TaxID=3458415 RepID=UPI0040384C2E